MLDFGAALRILKNKKKIKRDGWPEDCYIQLWRDSILFCHSNEFGTWHPLAEDLLAKDWRTLA